MHCVVMLNVKHTQVACLCVVTVLWYTITLLLIVSYIITLQFFDQLMLATCCYLIYYIWFLVYLTLMHKRNHHHGDSQADQFPIHPAVSARYSMTEMGYIPYRYYIIYNLSYRQRNEHYIYKHPIADQILPVNHSQPPSPLLFFNRREFYSLVPRLFVISVRAAISGARPGHFIEFECICQYVLPHVLN